MRWPSALIAPRSSRPFATENRSPGDLSVIRGFTVFGWQENKLDGTQVLLVGRLSAAKAAARLAVIVQTELTNHPVQLTGQ